MEAQRLQKIIADSGLCSRRKAEEMIKAGRVLLNGKVATIGQSATPQDEIIADGRKVVLQQRHYYAFNKPNDVETTMTLLKGRRTVADYILRFRPDLRLYAVGRLDCNTEGLLIVTNDGELANRIMHPRYEIEKTYEGQVDRPITNDAARMLERGIRLEDGRSWPAKVAIKGPAGRGFSIKIHEGRNRIVRRMFKELGYYVKELKRTQIGPITLGDLQHGKFRALNQYEIKALMQAPVSSAPVQVQQRQFRPSHQASSRYASHRPSRQRATPSRTSFRK